MFYDVISLLIPFLGFAVSLALFACCILLLIKRTQIVTSLLYLVLAVSYSAVLFKSLARQSTGYVCALPQTNTTLLYLIVIVLFCSLSSIGSNCFGRSIPAESRKGRTKPGTGAHLYSRQCCAYLSLFLAGRGTQKPPFPF